MQRTREIIFFIEFLLLQEFCFKEFLSNKGVTLSKTHTHTKNVHLTLLQHTLRIQ